MNNDNFLRPSLDDEDENSNSQPPAVEQPAQTTGKKFEFETENPPVTAKSNRTAAPFVMEEQEAPLPNGVAPAKRESSGSMKRLVVAVFLLAGFIALIGGLMLLRSFRTQDQKVEVKNAPGARTSATEQETNSESDDAIRRAKEVAAATAQAQQPGASPTPFGQQPGANQPSLQNGSILTQPPVSAQPLVGMPIYDTRQPGATATPSGDQNAQNLSRPSGGGGGSFGSGNGQNNRPAENRNPGENQTLRELPERPTKIEVPTSNGGRTLYFLAKNETTVGAVNPAAKYVAPVYKPPFGAVLPVRVLGALHTLQSGGLARMELTRTVEGNNWRLQRGTIFVGRVAGGADKRLFVSLIGYIEPRTNALIELSGDTLGRDGAIGLEGEKKQLHSRWKKFFGDALSKATQLGSAYLLGRRGGSGNVINTGNFDSMIDQANPFSQNSSEPSFVVVSAGANGYIMVNNLPPAKDVPTAPYRTNTDGDVLQAVPVTPQAGQIADDELIRILTNGSTEDIRRALPRMSPEWQNIAKQTLQMRSSEAN